MDSQVTKALIIHVVVIGAELALVAALLIRRGLFTPRHAGFWAWSSFTLYFILNPLFSLIEGNTSRYETVLNATGGVRQAYWILLVIWLGILAYFFIYLSSSSPTVTWGLSKGSEALTFQKALILMPFVGLAFYSLWFFRSGLGAVNRVSMIENGRFVGEVVGYESAGHLFMFVPVVLLILQKSRGWYYLGLGLALAYTVLTLPIGYARYATVSIVVAVAVADAVRRGKHWPRLTWLVGAVMLATILQIRGHVAWDISTVGAQIVDLSPQAINSLPDVFSSREVSMLGNFYLGSYYSNIIGYNYGLPTINYILTGWIPNQLFPQKYFLVDFLNTSRILMRDAYIDQLLHYVKYTMVGSFYADGGLFAVLVEMGLVGLLTRKMDGMLQSESPLIVQTLAICWMSLFWMMWGGAPTWALVRIGLFLMPCFGMWLVSSKEKTARESDSGATAGSEETRIQHSSL